MLLSQIAIEEYHAVQVHTADDHIAVILESTGDSGACPACGCESRRKHSSYTRKLRDLPVQGKPVCIYAQVRRFRCPNPLCSRITYAEPLPTLAPAHARRTRRLTCLLESFILAVSSHTGAILAGKLGAQVSPRTLLRIATKVSPSVEPPTVLGVDDFALRRGQNYATLLYDLVRKRVVDLLSGRRKDELTAWLKAHLGVEIIVRDRASAYAEAASEGALEAIQVADRFHLVKNVTDALQEVVDQKRWPMPAAPEPMQQQSAEPAPEPTPRNPSRLERLREAAAERRRQLHGEIHRRLQAGQSQRAIARKLGVCW